MHVMIKTLIEIANEQIYFILNSITQSTVVMQKQVQIPRFRIFTAAILYS